MKPGFQVLCRQDSVPAQWVERFREIPVANISDSMGRIAGAPDALRPMHRQGVLCGTALTVRTRPGDNLMVHMALNMAKEGDVIVVDAGGDLSNAIVGERMLAYCVAKKFAGVVVLGAVRDIAWIRQQDFPVYACGVNHRGPYKDGPGEINTPIALGSMQVCPGDLVVGDEDGLVCIPRVSLDAVHRKAAQKYKDESESFHSIGVGDNNERAYRTKLRELGCWFEDSSSSSEPA